MCPTRIWLVLHEPLSVQQANSVKAEQRGPGIQPGDDHESYESHMDASEVLHRLARGIILLPDSSGYASSRSTGQHQPQGTIQPLGEGDTEMFDNSDEEDDLGSQVHKDEGDEHATKDESRNTRGETPAPESSHEKKSAVPASEETLPSKALGDKEKDDKTD